MDNKAASKKVRIDLQESDHDKLREIASRFNLSLTTFLGFLIKRILNHPTRMNDILSSKNVLILALTALSLNLTAAQWGYICHNEHPQIAREMVPYNKYYIKAFDCHIHRKATPSGYYWGAHLCDAAVDRYQASGNIEDCFKTVQVTKAQYDELLAHRRTDNSFSLRTDCSEFHVDLEELLATEIICAFNKTPAMQVNINPTQTVPVYEYNCVEWNVTWHTCGNPADDGNASNVFVLPPDDGVHKYVYYVSPNTWPAHAHYMNLETNELIADKWVWVLSDGDTMSNTNEIPRDRIFWVEGTLVPPNQDNRFFPGDNISASHNTAIGYNEYIPLNSNTPDLWNCPDMLTYRKLYEACSKQDPQEQRSMLTWMKYKRSTGGCEDKNEFSSMYDVYDISGDWDNTLNCGEGGYKIQRTANDPTGEEMTVDKPFLYDKNGNCINCGGEGWITYKCYDNWKLKYGVDYPKCDALYAVNGTVIAGALAAGFTGLGTAAAVATAVAGLKEMYEAGCVKFGYNGDEDCNSELYKFAKWYTSQVANRKWYVEDTLAVGQALPSNAPEYSERTHPEDWSNDLRLRFAGQRDSSDEKVSDYHVRMMDSHPQIGLLKEEQIDLLNGIFTKQANASPDISFPKLKSKKINTSKSAEETYLPQDLDEDIGNSDLSDLPGHDAASANRKAQAVENFRNK